MTAHRRAQGDLALPSLKEATLSLLYQSLPKAGRLALRLRITLERLPGLHPTSLRMFTSEAHGSCYLTVAVLSPFTSAFLHQPPDTCSPPPPPLRSHRKATSPGAATRGPGFTTLRHMLTSLCWVCAASSKMPAGLTWPQWGSQ